VGSNDKLRRWAGWICLGFVAVFCLLGYYFRNVRFAPIAGGFLILSAVCLIECGRGQVRSNAIHTGTDSGIGRAGG
jgi:hypothetical protein